VTRVKKGSATGAARFRTAAVKGKSWSRKAGALKRGTYVIRVRAVDAAGNVSAVVRKTIRLH
jgi:hypothetical protein